MAINVNQGVKVFDMVVNVTAPLEGELKDWPSEIQDKIWQALEAKANEVELPLTVIASYCGVDHGETKEQDKFFLHVVASEIVAKDNRFDNPEAMKAAFDEIIKQSGGLQ